MEKPSTLNLPKAKTLLDEAGFANGFVLSLEVLAAPPYIEIANKTGHQHRW